MSHANPGNHPVAAGTGSAPGDAGTPVLEVDGVTKTYPAEPPVQALRKVNLSIGPGELVGDRRPVRVGQDHPLAADGDP